jgi:hypothetical protein
MFHNSNNFVSLLKNKYGNFVLQKALSRMSPEGKNEIKDFVCKKISINGGKEKQKLSSLLDMM